MNDSVLNCIEKKLKSFINGDEGMNKVFYGACTDKEMDSWNYFVFNRKRTYKAGTSRTDMQTDYEIHIVHEDYIPEGFVEKVIEELQNSDAELGVKLKLKGDDIVYDYTFKNNTGMVVEIATIIVTRPCKRCA